MSCVVPLARRGSPKFSTPGDSQVASNDSTISDTGGLVKIAVGPRGAVRQEHWFCQGAAISLPDPTPAEPRCLTQCWNDAQLGRARVRYRVPAPWGATVDVSGAVRLMYGEMVSSQEESTAGRVVPVRPPSVESRGAGRSDKVQHRSDSSAAGDGPRAIAL
ncbi:hypothetical protein NDU88_005919 [Pleurodeles waltl]|uniref:Uncharacterized protein n=1 Tax=Pleurodeles waltl TaxID=8319 RepID=A0AAV7WZ28_PLEWA|nr:hypothetical protein NDU88_005919 [Pleurodeles waltl]